MKIVSYADKQKQTHTGLLVNDQIYNLRDNARAINLELPSHMADFLKGEDRLMDRARVTEQAIRSGKTDISVSPSEITLLAPVPSPTSCRDAYAFRQHVATARRNRGVDMIPEFDQFPVFYFTNHNSVGGPGDVTVESDHLKRLDFELECAIVIGKRGKNIPASEADSYIAGYLIMNDLSARQLQMEEMKLNLGPAKGKDFATTIGPWLVTPDELEPHLIKTDQGNKYDLRMTAHHNGNQVSDGNLKDMNYTFAEIIERVSYGVDIYPGDVIGSGTVGTGCYLERNGTWALEAKARGEEHTPVWLQDGDTIELHIDCLGTLTNRIVKTKTDYSILAKKRQL